MSRKKKLGACSGKLRVSCRVSLTSITASVTSSVMPSPSDRTREGVSAPGRWRLASARRGAALARARQAPGERHDADRDEPQQREGAGRRGDEDQRDLAVIGGDNREADEERDGDAERDEIALARPAPLGIDLVAEQAGDRHVVRPPERRDREDERRQRAVEERDAEFAEGERRRRSGSAGDGRTVRRRGRAGRRRRRARSRCRTRRSA